VKAYKLFHKRVDGTLGPLFINRRLRVPVGEWLPAEDHPTKGFARRPGWHAMPSMEGSHLAKSAKGHGTRVWCEVEIRTYVVHNYVCHGKTRPWYLAEWLKVIREIG
jgi:hypothetical protein